MIGVSPSGKALDFDSSIPRFESWHPSHNLRLGLDGYDHHGIFLKTGARMRTVKVRHPTVREGERRSIATAARRARPKAE